MDIQEGIFAEAMADTALATKLDNGAGGHHFYPVTVPADITFGQAVIYNEITNTLTYPLLHVATYQFTCVADTFEKARDLANDIERIFNDLNDTKLGGNSGFGIRYCKFEGRSTFYDDNTKLYYFFVEISIKF